MAQWFFDSDIFWALTQAIWLLYALPVLALAMWTPDMRDLRRRVLGTLIRWIDGLNHTVGSVACWMTLAMVLVQFLIVLLRYVFGLSFIAMQEFMLYLHGGLFMLAGGYTLLRDGHVRVDIFYGAASPKRQAMVNLFGTYALLLPAMALLFYVSWPVVGQSWAIVETSQEDSGMPVFLLKTLLLLFPALLLLQGVSLAARSVLILAGDTPPDRPGLDEEVRT